MQTLRAAGVNVHVFEDTAEPEKPDAVFPNNWISTHHDGRIALFPMYSALRRRERRHDIIGELRKHYRVTEVETIRHWKRKAARLEGTGSRPYRGRLARQDLGLISFLRARVSAGPEVPDRRIAPAPAEVPPEMMIVAERAGRAEGSGWHPAVAAVRPLGEIRLAALAIPLSRSRVSRAQPCPDLAPAEYPQAALFPGGGILHGHQDGGGTG